MCFWFYESSGRECYLTRAAPRNPHTNMRRRKHHSTTTQSFGLVLLEASV
jgi:hypothetical protein